MENKKSLDPAQLKDTSGGNYDEAMAYFYEIAQLHGWDLSQVDYTWVINHMDEHEYATFVKKYNH